MKNIFYFLFLVLATIPLYGCCSLFVSEGVGMETFVIKDVSVEISGNEIKVTQYGVLEKSYFPPIKFPCPKQERNYTYPLGVLPEDEYSPHVQTFRLKKSEDKTNKITETKYGLPYFDYKKPGLKSMGFTNEKETIFLSPDDFAKIETPFVFCDSYGGDDRFLNPYSQELLDDGVILLSAYSPRNPYRMFPGTYVKSLSPERMTGTGVNIYRATLLPIAICLDVATFPLQSIGLYILLANMKP